MIYIDTNIFLYAADKESQYFADCTTFLSSCIKENIDITTSAETIQEIVHYLKNRNTIKDAPHICNTILKIIPTPLALDISVLEVFIKMVSEYGDNRKIQSRDLLYVATCIENDIGTIVTYDKAFSQIKEIKAQTPKQFLSLMPLG
ncbi:MAG: type II toxin-antitoxin system VapC family toxin [Candidatus Roizmanbacteria bacterium]